MTSWPRSAKQAPATRPTYPEPTTAICMLVSLPTNPRIDAQSVGKAYFSKFLSWGGMRMAREGRNLARSRQTAAGFAPLLRDCAAAVVGTAGGRALPMVSGNLCDRELFLVPPAPGQPNARKVGRTTQSCQCKFDPDRAAGRANQPIRFGNEVDQNFQCHLYRARS